MDGLDLAAVPAETRSDLPRHDPRWLGEGLIVDNFAGGGGASTGIELALGRSPDVAINHDAEAVALHAANHPETLHLCQNVWKADPCEVVRQTGLSTGHVQNLKRDRSRRSVRPAEDPRAR